MMKMYKLLVMTQRVYICEQERGNNFNNNERLLE